MIPFSVNHLSYFSVCFELLKLYSLTFKKYLYICVLSNFLKKKVFYVAISIQLFNLYVIYFILIYVLLN